MPHPYEFNRLQEAAAQAVGEVLTLHEKARLAMDAAYPVGSIIEMQHRPDSELIRLRVLPQNGPALHFIDRGKGNIWCENLNRWEPPLQIDTHKLAKEYHRFAVVKHGETICGHACQSLTGTAKDNRAAFIDRVKQYPKASAIFIIHPSDFAAEVASMLAHSLDELGHAITVSNGKIKFKKGGTIHVVRYRSAEGTNRFHGMQFETLFISERRDLSEMALVDLCSLFRPQMTKVEGIPEPLVMLCTPSL